ncbi:hypothetical protein ACIPJM_04610 [Streptomyces halstedii]|uniref:hypothetical protein n=1 Tax=Streptomyces halstedii TaxID=1944 RepID=UPI00382F2AE2
MGTREYVGAGGMHLHLDDPLSPEMAKQVQRGHLVPVADPEPTPDSEPETPTPDPGQGGGTKRPTANAKVDDWRAYALSLGMPEDDAKTATKVECQEYAQVVEDSQE